MKVGSLVICINNSSYGAIPGMIVPKLHPMIYTVRRIAWCSCKCGKAGLLLEEIVNKSSILPGEVMYDLKDFRELQHDIQNVKIEDLMKEDAK